MSGDSGARHDRVSIKDTTFFAMPIKIPSGQEQNKIATFLEKINTRIEKQTALVESLKKYKRELLQVIFDDNTVDLFGEVKQSNFVKLSDILIFQNGINADSSKYGQGRKYISVSDILKNDFITYEQIVGLIDIDDITLEKYSVTYGDVLFQRSSETREDAGRSNVYLDKIHTATFGGFVIRGKKKAEYNPLYLKYALDSTSVRKQIMKCAAGAQHINISQDDLSNVIVNLPDMKIQDDISCFISHLDNRMNFISQQKNPDYLAWYFKSDAWHRYIYDNGSQGVRHDRVSMTDDLLMGIPVSVPNASIQCQIAKTLNGIESRLSAVQTEYDILIKQRNGFMQQLFI